MAQVIQVIDMSVRRGKGTQDDPIRNVRQFWSLDGQLLMEHDPWASVGPIFIGPGGVDNPLTVS